MKVLVIGSGYLGSEAARLWLADGGNDVHVVTRSRKRADQFMQAGFKPVIADVTNVESLESFPDSIDVVLFAVGFDRSSYADIRDVYVTGLQNVLIRLNDECRHLVYVSSTGVYGNCNGEWVNESTLPSPIRPGGKACLEAEALIQSNPISARSTILRLAGIYGPGRVPCLSAIKNNNWPLLGKQGHINLIHRHDAANIICEVVRQEIVNEILLVSDGRPVHRRTFYDFIADRLNLGSIDWSVPSDSAVDRRSTADKKISNRKLINAINYQYRYPDYQSGLKDALTDDF